MTHSHHNPPGTDRGPRPPVTVLPVPPRLAENPYLDLLHGALARAGAVIRADSFTRRAILRLPRGGSVVHVHFLWLKSGVVARRLRAFRALRCLRLCRRLGIPVVATAHNIEPHDAGRLDRRVSAAVYRAAAAVIAHGEAAAAALRTDGVAAPIRVIPHGHYIDATGPLVPTAEARRRLGIPEPPLVILAFGLLRPYKGLDTLVAAFRKLRTDARLLIAGRALDAGLAVRLRAAATEDPRILLREGFVSPEDVPLLHGAADVVALPFRRITTSGSLILALSLGRPVVVPDLPVLHDVVGPDCAFFFREDSDLQALLAGLPRAALPAMGAAALARARTLAWEPIAAATLEVYRSVLAAC